MINENQIKFYLTENEGSPFEEWFNSLNDDIAKVNIIQRLDRVELGNFGDFDFVGDGVYELRIHFGPGYRVYYGKDGRTLIIILAGGAKKAQKRNIKKAKQYWQDYKKRKKKKPR